VSANIIKHRHDLTTQQQEFTFPLSSEISFGSECIQL